MEVLPALSSHLASKNYVVHTYATVCLERIFAMKAGPIFMFQSADVLPVAGSIVGRLFDLIEADPRPAKLAENDYLMKGIHAFPRRVETMLTVTGQQSCELSLS